MWIGIVLGVLSLLAGLAYSFQVLYFYYGFTGSKTVNPNIQSTNTTVSIIVVARNEELNIAACVQSLLAQNYPAHLMEIIIVDDDSADATVPQLAAIKNKEKIKLIRLIPGIEQGKKVAITKAVGEARGKLIVTTDADCILPPFWIATLVNCYEQSNASMLLGPVAFYNEVTLFEKIQSLEFMALMGITAGAANLKKPFLCNGANLAYTKATFTTFNGYGGVSAVASGDDMLLLQKIKRKTPAAVAFVMNNNAIVQTKAQPTLKKFIDQRKRWFTKNLILPDRITNTIAFIVFFICALIIINLVAACVSGNYNLLYYALGLFISKSVVDFILLYTVTRFFKKSKLLLYFFHAQLFIIIYSCFMVFTLWNKTYSWKGRKLK